MNNTSTTIGTVCFLTDDPNDRILLLQRSGPPMKNKVTGVGGKTRFTEDIHSSCIREIKEETGYDAKNLKLRGIIKTIENDGESSWLLFVYTTGEFGGRQQECPEGKLYWVDKKALLDQDLIGFIREILPRILQGDTIEGTIIHDREGNVIKSQVRTV